MLAVERPLALPRPGEWREQEALRAPSPVFLTSEGGERTEVQAEFGFDLAGVVRETERTSATQPENRCRLADLSALLSSAQTLSWVFANGCPLRNGHWRWQIRGQSQAEMPHDAERSAQEMMQGLVAWLSARHPWLVLDPVRDARQLERQGGWAYRTPLRPPAVVCRIGPGRTVGFGASSERNGTRWEFRLPVPGAEDAAPSLEAALRVLAFRNEPTALSLDLTPVALDAYAAQLLRVFGAQLRKGGGQVSMLGQWMSVGSQDATASDQLYRAVQAWSQQSAGIRISATLLTVHEPPDSLCRMLSRELFSQGAPETKDAVLPVAHPSLPPIVGLDPSSVDLSDCVTTGVGSPWILPSVDFWRGHGIPIVCSPMSGPVTREGIVLGTARIGFAVREIRFGERDRAAHTYVCGATGTGKSTLLFNMVLQDIESGRGVCLIDPHGDLYSQVLASIPRSRVDDVVVIDPQDREHAVGLNLLDRQPGAGPEQLHFLVNELLKVFERLYNMRDAGGPMFEQYMRNGLLLAAYNNLGRSTIMDVQAIFEDAEFRSFLKARCEDPLVASFWDKMAERVGGDHSLVNMGPYISSKLNLFTSNAAVRRIVGQPRSTVDFREAMDRGRIVLVNLSQGVLGELDTQLLGMLLIGKIYGAAMGRATLPPADRRPFHLYVDEFQMFTTDTVAHMLTGARKFGLCLTLANQNLSQLLVSLGKQNILEAVLGNCGSLLCFRLGVADAARLESYTLPVLRAADLQELPSYQAATRLLADTVPTRPFILTTHPPRRTNDAAPPDEVRELSRARYTRPAAAIESDIRSWRFNYEAIAANARSESATTEGLFGAPDLSGDSDPTTGD